MAKTAVKATGNIERTLEGISVQKRPSWFWFAALLVLYFVVSVFVIQTARSEDVLILMGQPLPIRSLTGAFSSIANISLIFIVLFYGKAGFIVALVVLLAQFPILLFGMIVSHVFNNIPGFFSNVLVILTVILIYRNNDRIKKYQQRIRAQAVTDRLTGLPNRFACSELMDDLVKKSEKFVIACFNLNNFKSINNTMGTKTGNDVLIEVGNRLRDVANAGTTGTNDFVTYQGSDEFSLIIRDYQTDEDVKRSIALYESAIEERLTLDDCDYFMSASIGYAEFPKDTTDSDVLLSYADAALQVAKHDSSGELACRFTPKILDEEHTLEMERKIRMALDNGTLYFNLQPQFDIDHRLIGFEALARMRDASGNFVSPGDFIPVAEKVGLIDKVDLAVFKKSAAFFGDVVRRTNSTDLTLSINVSVKHLMKNDFVEEVVAVLEESGLAAEQLEIEITESVMIDSAEKALQCIEEIKRLGIRIAIDDFGTGYSSLSYLNSFPADLLKVDKSFVDKMNLGESSKQYVAAIITIGHVMNFSVIAEGVEEAEQLETLREIGCDYIQGFFWGCPLEPDVAEQLVMEHA